MSKERMTEKTKDCFGYRLKDGSDAEVGFFKNYNAFYSHMMMVKALGEYEDLEEQGLLLRLPCKVGDTVYYSSFGKVFSAEVVEVKYVCEVENYGKFIRHKITIDGEESGIVTIDFPDIGKKYFNTQSEAEEKMCEMEK